MPIDTTNIKDSDCRKKEFPLNDLALTKRPSGFQIVVKRSTLNTMKRHGKTSMHAEVGGMLAGSLCWDGEPFLLIEASIIGEHTNGNTASVTFTGETWDRVWEVCEKDYSDCNIVGWYHTHPGFGIFLSGMDLFICDHTFNAPHHVAYVYDPQSEDDGWFIWKNSTPSKLLPLVIEDIPDEIVSSNQSQTMPAMQNNFAVQQSERQWLLPLILISNLLLILCVAGLVYLVWKQDTKTMQDKIERLEKRVIELENQKFSVAQIDSFIQTNDGRGNIYNQQAYLWTLTNNKFRLILPYGVNVEILNTDNPQYRRNDSDDSIFRKRSPNNP